MASRNQSWQADLESYPEHFRKLIKAKVAEEDGVGEQAPTQQGFQPIIPPQLWESPPPPEIKIVVHRDHGTAAMLLVAFGICFAAVSAVLFMLVKMVAPWLLLAMAGGFAIATGIRTGRKGNQ
jgi:hypothetical protein